jgi:hypothetical protein
MLYPSPPAGNEVLTGQAEETMRRYFRLTAVVGVAALLALPAIAADIPKRGGTLTYTIPADAPPSFDGHREGTFAMLHATAPF